MKQSIRVKDIVAYMATIVFALLFLFIGNRIASQNMVEFQSDDFLKVNARVLEITDITEHYDEWFSTAIITFEARITSGEYRNEIVTATQSLDDSWGIEPVEISVGDNVQLALVQAFFDSPEEWIYFDHVRINQIIILGAVFVLLLLMFGRGKGFNAIISLGFTCAAIFTVLIPAILSGKNIYISSIIVCAFAVVITLFILNGVNKKSLAAIIGCLGGVIAAGIITLIMNQTLQLTGMIDSDSRYLMFLPTENPIDLRALIFAGIIIGAVGAIMDVAVSISSALWELKTQAPKLTFSKLYNSGINIGKDIMGSMTNTLVLAYIGSSLTVILLLIVFSGSFNELFNREMVIVELLQALIGSLGILLTMPLTALVCAVFYSKKTDSGHTA